MKDLEPILNVLCNYHAGFVLSDDELRLLRGWLAESPDHERLFDELNNKNGSGAHNHQAANPDDEKLMF